MTRGLACLAAVGVALALAPAACGGDSERAASPVKASGTAPPEPPPPTLAYASGAREALKGGAVAVADFAYRVAIAPSKMDINREQRLSKLRWSGWGSKRATARADLRTLVCDPNCAQGVYKDSRAQVVLSAPKRCGGRRFYTRASMTYEDPETGKTRAPATYLRTPPC